MGAQFIPNTKRWYKSTTIWINTIPVVAILLDTMLQANLIHDKDVLAVVIGLANILNRLRTSEGIK